MYVPIILILLLEIDDFCLTYTYILALGNLFQLDILQSNCVAALSQ